MKLKTKLKSSLNESFYKRKGKYAFFAFLLIGFSMGIDTLCYHYFAHITGLDSFYMASMVLIGIGQVSDMSNDAAK